MTDHILVIHCWRETDSWVAAEVAGALAPLDPTAEDRRQARDALLALRGLSNNGTASGVSLDAREVG